MKKITDITNQYPTLYKAAKALGLHQEQLTRWVKAGAMVDDKGCIWIKTKGQIVN